MPDDDLRTALTKLADEMEAHHARGHTWWAGPADLRALLAAHPAEVVTDTRREDAARARIVEYLRQFDRLRDTGGMIHNAHTDPESDEGATLYADDLRAVLAVLPAPPVADEAEVQERIAQDIAEAAVDDGMSSDWRYGMRVAAGIARGATR